MKRLFLPIAVILVLAVCVAIAGDFWAAKKFSTWNDEETKKVIESSPWARQVPIKYIFCYWIHALLYISELCSNL